MLYLGLRSTVARMTLLGIDTAYRQENRQLHSLLTLRVTTVVRRDGGQWKVVHRHGDPLDLASHEVLSRRRQQRVM